MDTYEKAKKLASGLVAQRMYTCKEVEDRLKRKKIDAETAERVVAEFAECGILDDKLYASAYIEDAVRLGVKGIFRIKQELYSKGVARGIIDYACENCEEDTLSVLRDYVEARHLCDGITTRRDFEKLKARLARRGFSSSEIKECLSEYSFDFSDEE